MSVLLPLFKGRGKTPAAFAIVDEADAAVVASHRWHPTAYGYAATYERATGKTIYLHRFLLGLRPGDGLEGDHRNGERLDFRRSNLRIVPKHGNRQNKRAYRTNRCGIRGVSRTRGGRWRAKVQVDGKSHRVGTFDTPGEAGRAAADYRAKHMPFSREASWAFDKATIRAHDVAIEVRPPEPR